MLPLFFAILTAYLFVFNDAVSGSDCTAANGRVINELLFRNLPGGIKENHEKQKSA
jgi:hypothetical protein